MEIGTVEGAVNTEKFRFEAHRDIEKFDFIAVKSYTDEAEWMLAQVDEVEKQPLKDQDKIDKAYKTVASANIIGYRVNGLLKKPRSVIEPDSLVYQADQDIISRTLGLEENGLYMGLLLTNPDINVYLDPEELYKHIAVLAKTGAGKSYSTGVLIEELLEKNYPVVIIDPHGEYHTLGKSNSIKQEFQEQYGVNPRGYDLQQYSPNTELNKQAEQISFSSENMDAREIQNIVPTNLTNSQLGVLYTALKELKERETYDLDDIIETCMAQESKAKWNLVNLLETVRDSGLFSDNPTDLENMIQRGQATIINLRGVDPEVQESVVYKFAKETFELRKRGRLKPFFMILEEAHNFVPEKGMKKAVCSDVLRKIASEGRKFGLGLGVISQRPANVAKNILSQCNTQLIMRVTNPNDLSAISRSFEGVTSAVENSITSLSPGVGLILGKEYPIMTDIRVRRSRHGGATKELSEDADTATEPPAETREHSEPTEPGEPVETAPAPPKAQKPAKRQISYFTPTLRFSQAKETLENPEKTFYPVYLVSTKVGSMIIDGVDGDIKDRDLSLTEEADKLLQLLKQGDATKEELIEKSGMGPGTVASVLKGLQKYSLAEKHGQTYSYTGAGLFDKELIDDRVDSQKCNIISAEITEDEAIEIVKRQLESDIIEIDLLYYPYYKSGDTVFDAILNEEV